MVAFVWIVYKNLSHFNPAVILLYSLYFLPCLKTGHPKLPRAASPYFQMRCPMTYPRDIPLYPYHTVDGRNPAPWMVETL